MSTGVLFSDLSARGQQAVLRKLALSGAERFGLSEGDLKFIHSGENATFSYDTVSLLCELPTPFHPNRVLIRLHGTAFKSDDWIRSEMQWLAALRESGLVVPEPVLSVDGRFVEHVSCDGVDRPCTVMRWIDGRRGNICGLNRMQLTGRLMAQLHDHSDSWKLPKGFDRRHWNYDEFFGNATNLGAPTEVLWKEVPQDLVKPMREMADRFHKIYPVDPGDRPFGLVHADLHTWNTVMHQGAVYPIDFDDCGFAYHIMDFANVLEQPLGKPGWHERAASFVQGYRSVRSFPDDEWRMIGLAMAMRCASNVLWLIDKAQTNAVYRKNLDKWIEDDRVALDEALKIHADMSN